jgi:hypothetical protein
MTTISTPSGTPTIIYNRDGLTVDAISGNGTTSGSATAMTRYCQHTVVSVTVTTNNTAVKLPTGAEIGDVVEVYNVAGFPLAPDVFPPSGETLVNSNTDISCTGGGAIFRKVTSTSWAFIIG